MKVIESRCLDVAYGRGLLHLLDNGIEQESRVGKVLVSPTPVTTVYKNPTQRVLFNPRRNANPFFHLMECIWMMAGRRDVQWIKFYNRRMDSYSDDQETFHGAYGFRWRRHFGQEGEKTIDQIKLAVSLLKKNRDDRRIVLTMWDPNADFGREGLDFPCNTHIYFRVREGKLDMTVCNRSNDIIWGCYGANAVHMSFLQEVIAGMAGLAVGVYYQISNNFHLYLEIFEKIHGVSMDQNYNDVMKAIVATEANRYEKQNLRVIDIDAEEDFLEQCEAFCEGREDGWDSIFLQEVASPISLAWQHYRAGELNEAIKMITEMTDCDWKVACYEWLKRVEEKRNVS